MGRKNRRDDRIRFDKPEWRRTSSGRWERMYKSDMKLEHEKVDLRKNKKRP